MRTELDAICAAQNLVALKNWQWFLTSASGCLQCACHAWINSVPISTPRICREAFGVHSTRGNEINLHVLEHDVGQPHTVGGNADLRDAAVLRNVPGQMWVHPFLQA